jgi:hypothetical protein
MTKAFFNIDHSLVFRNAKTVLDMGEQVEMIYLIVTFNQNKLLGFLLILY